MNIPITTIMDSRPDGQIQLLALIKELVKETRLEPGCISYRLQQGYNGNNVFIIWEEWADEPAIQKHKAQPHFVYFVEMAISLLKKPITVYQSIYVS
ncbi:MAG: antibiotic biosynthesis monooxygenase [Bacteroidota bacterium]|nr:antibiotic biosynthesis monooxygenase [Bacteroidota bacterium]